MKQKGDGVGFGIASLVLGVASAFLFGCCVNYIMAVLAIIFGIVQMVKNRQKGVAIAGIVTAGISIILGTVFWVAVASKMDDMNLEDYYNTNPYQFYQEDGPYNNYLEDYLDEL
ncbi:MAG: DUF4190 domain-containing protein [Muribaculaceae bacterium]|nr:DUF4190 domain-containing protein [Roseburia sp.]MCM1431446.1 DUF4190 domain-containing protein [Muribaculaceae bacterium]MCM1493260.1 DUF4190 domain-containing protein [Muribaculaceae bacterium]